MFWTFALFEINRLLVLMPLQRWQKSETTATSLLVAAEPRVFVWQLKGIILPGMQTVKWHKELRPSLQQGAQFYVAGLLYHKGIRKELWSFQS